MIYLDNAATTLHKPPGVIKEMNQCLRHYCANAGRGGHKLSMKAGQKIYECRENLAKLFGVSAPENIVFTNNTTMALNIGIKGLIDRNSHVVISGMEHNSVIRPIVAIGCKYSIAEADEFGMVSSQSVEKQITDNTKLIIVTHASNITGTVNPIEEIAALAQKRNIPFMVDCAQSAGVIPIDVDKMNLSMLAFAGHKTLYGPTGTGGLYISPSLKLSTFIEGGTGSLSESILQPDFLPDRFESGTMNIVGIAGLNEGVKYVVKITQEEIYSKEKVLIDALAERLDDINRVKLYGNDKRVGICGFTVEGFDSINFANILNEKYNIAARGGFHCTMLGHKSMGTEDGGMVRLSVSYFSKMREIDTAIKAVKEICNLK